MPIQNKHVLVFPMNEVRTLLEHTQRSRDHAPTYEQLYNPDLRLDGKEVPDGVLPTSDEIDQRKVPAGLFLVGDDGAYLMSNGLPADTAPDGRHRVVYADGLNPYEVEFEIWWEAKRRILGGDDGQVIYISAEDIVRGLAGPADQLKIEIVSNTMSVTRLTVL